MYKYIIFTIYLFLPYIQIYEKKTKKVNSLISFNMKYLVLWAGFIIFAVGDDRRHTSTVCGAVSTKKACSSLRATR